MRRTATMLAMAALVALAAPARAQVPALPDGDPAVADALTTYRARASVGKHREAWQAFAKLAADHPDDRALQLWCARTSFHFAHRLVQADDKSGAAKVAKAGVECSRRVQAKNPGDYDGRYWELMNQYKEGATLSPVSVLKAVKPVRAALEELISRDAKRFEGMVFLAMAYRELPSVLSWGDDRKALEWARKAEALAPRDPEVLLEMAEASWENGEEETARVYFGRVATSDVPRDLEWETEDCRAWARKRLDEVK